jgi:integrase
MTIRLDRVDARSKLITRTDPYWQRLTQGRFIGFRRMTAGTPGTWLARFYDGEKYQYQPLGDFALLSEKERFDAAKVAADDWFRHLDHGGSTDSLTVKGACAAYVDKQRLEKSGRAADDAKGRFARLIDTDPLGRVDLQKLAPRHLAEWKKRLLNSGCSRASFNRNATSLRAALNLAYQRRDIASNHAWAEELKPLEGADNRRELYLDRTARRKLIDMASGEVKPFVTSLSLLPFRPGEVALLKVENLDIRHRMLNVPSGKTGARPIPLGGDALTHFKACAKDKLPGAWLVSRADGGQWKKEAWRDHIKDAAKAARLPADTCAYSLRHSVITDLVTGGLDLFTIAKISGTSISMIEKHYGHLQREHARTALEALAL